MSSLSSLPTELLIELFAVCAVLDPQSPPTLAGLSRRLRAIILGAPTIWQSIHLQDDPPSSATQSALWLARSHPLPFDVHVNLSTQDAPGLLGLLAPFLAHLPRWRTYAASGARTDTVRLSSLLPPSCVPELHYLSIALGFTPESGPGARDSSPFYACGMPPHNPHHISLSLASPRIPAIALHVYVPCVALDITAPTLDAPLAPRRILGLLRATPALEELYLAGTLHADPIPIDINVDRTYPTDTTHSGEAGLVDLPRLWLIRIRSTTTQRAILPHLRAPALRELWLQHLNVDFVLPPVPGEPPAEAIEDPVLTALFNDFIGAVIGGQLGPAQGPLGPVGAVGTAAGDVTAHHPAVAAPAHDTGGTANLDPAPGPTASSSSSFYATAPGSPTAPAFSASPSPSPSRTPSASPSPVNPTDSPHDTDDADDTTVEVGAHVDVANTGAYLSVDVDVNVDADADAHLDGESSADLNADEDPIDADIVIVIGNENDNDNDNDDDIMPPPAPAPTPAADFSRSPHSDLHTGSALRLLLFPPPLSSSSSSPPSRNASTSATSNGTRHTGHDAHAHSEPSKANPEDEDEQPILPAGPAPSPAVPFPFPAPTPALEVLDMDYADMRPADFAWAFARLARLRVFRISGSDMGDGVIGVLAPFRTEREKSSVERGEGEGKGKGKGRERGREEGVGLDVDVDPNSNTHEIAEGAEGAEGAQGEMGQAGGGEGEWTIRLPRLEHLELRGCVRLSPGALVDALVARVRFTDARVRARSLSSSSSSELQAAPPPSMGASVSAPAGVDQEGPGDENNDSHGKGKAKARDEREREEKNSNGEGSIRTLRTLVLVDCALQPAHAAALMDAFGARVRFVV